MLKGKHGRLIECVMETVGGFAAVGITSRWISWHAGGGAPQGTICSLRHTSDCDKCVLRGRSAKVISPCKQCKHVAVPDSSSKSLAPPNFSSISPHWTEVLAGRVIKFGGQGDREAFLAFLTDLVQTWVCEETLIHPCWSWAKQQASHLPLQSSRDHKGFYPDSPNSLATPVH